MAGQIPDDPFAGSLSDPGIDPFEIPEVPEPRLTSAAGQARASAKPVPGPISPNQKLQPESLYSRMRQGVLNTLGLNQPALQRTRDSGIFDAPLYTAPGPTKGMTAPGNINLRSLPPVDLGNGQWGTVRSASSEQDGKEVLYPTIVNGRPMDEDAARDYAFKTGRNLGTFKDPASADAYAQRLHSDWEKGVIPGVQMSPRSGTGGWRDPTLWQPQPNPAYSPRFDAAAQQLGSMIDPSQHGMTGELLGMVGGALPGTMASQVPVKSIPVWAAANMAMRGSAEYEPLKAAMLRDYPSMAEAQLQDLYPKAKKIYESHIAKTPLNELSEHHLPNLQSIVDQYNKGIEGQDWYLHTRPELEAQFGPDSDLFINMLAATSPNATVPANMSLALKAYKAYKNGLRDFSQFSDNPAHPGFMKPVIDNLNHVIRNEPISGQKIINFAKNLRGETEPVTVDRWMMRALGMPKAPLGPNTYKFADYWLSQIAHDQGVEPRQLQAAVWKTAREVGGQSAATGQPFEAMLAKRLAKDPALAEMLSKVRSAAVPAMARGGIARFQGGGDVAAIPGTWQKEYRTQGQGRSVEEDVAMARAHPTNPPIWENYNATTPMSAAGFARNNPGVFPSDNPYPGEPTVFQTATQPWSQPTGPIGAPGEPIPPDRSGVYPPDNPQYYEGQLVFPGQKPGEATTQVKPPFFYKWGWGRGSEPNAEEHAKLQQMQEDWAEWNILQQQRAAGMPAYLQRNAGMQQPPPPPPNPQSYTTFSNVRSGAPASASPDLDYRPTRDPKFKSDLDYWRDKTLKALGFQQGGWNDPALWQRQPNPAYLGTFNQMGNYVGSLGPSFVQGVADPVLGTLQLANLLNPDRREAAAFDQAVKNQRERYKQSLPGGKEDWAHQAARIGTSGIAAGEALPEVEIGQGLGRVGSKIASGAAEGAMYGSTVPKESNRELLETLITSAGGGLGGIAEELAVPPIKRGLGRVLEHVLPPEAAANVAEQTVTHAANVAPDPSDFVPIPDAEDVPSDIPEGLNYLERGYAGGGLYGRMRSATLAALQRSH